MILSLIFILAVPNRQRIRIVKRESLVDSVRSFLDRLDRWVFIADPSSLHFAGFLWVMGLIENFAGQS